ncbi:hypothetical protein CLNEO_07760 [Anaerotignum neopropionicum]|uniref:DUF4367 domain-containing protein n=1 Tax=Anaerotignum neopropionicum TaxID=36847 RepID=A0A136WGI5_9FIRM|nr:hypothetical protein [Anaerotignum neopropionicum]KXL53550.1 hypothetical protein CLNEO_07760 [Anaerotignum neopropionicum]
MRSFTNFDEKIKKALTQEVDDISPSDHMLSNIQKQITDRKEDNNMKIKSVKHSKGIMVACAILVLTTATCFAASKIASISGSIDKKLDTFPTTKQMETTAGFTPKYVEEFSNGYKFEVVFAGTLDANDADENKVSEIKTADFTYEKDGAEFYIEAMQKPKNASIPDMEGELVTLTNGQNVYYHDWMHKFKPADYVMTEQDKIDQANGTYEFAFGEDLDFIQHCQVVEWEENNIRYSVFCYDDNLTKADMVKISEEVINKN